MEGKVFATLINCMDGRTQLPANVWMREHFGADYIDTITEPGPDGIMAKGVPEITSIKRRLPISVNGHGSRTVARVGHHDCAGNPGPREQHFEEVLSGCRLLETWELPIRVIGLWIGPDWKVERIYDSE